MISVIEVFLYFSLICGSVLSEGATIVNPCEVNDLDCIKKSSSQFAEETHKGIPNYDVKTTDPLIIPSLDYVVADLGLVYRLKNVNVTGLKSQKLSDVKMDTVAKSVVLTTQSDLNIVGDVIIEIIRRSKSFSGTYAAKATAAGTAAYNYEITKDAKGVEHFDVGPETTSCQIVGDLKHAISSEQELENDPDNKDIVQAYNVRKADIRRNIFCRIIEEAYHTVVHNIRASARALPKDAFFKDI